VGPLSLSELLGSRSPRSRRCRSRIAPWPETPRADHSRSTDTRTEDLVRNAAYTKDGNVICFFQNAGKFKARYQTLGFSDRANLDDGAMWPNSYALMKLTATEEAKITALVKKAVR
jgi:hypothetical protein